MAATKVKKANEAHFHFICTGLDPNTFEVSDFTGVEKISCPYQFNITLISKKSDIGFDQLINKSATFYIFGKDGYYYPYTGVVSDFKLVDKNTDFSTYCARLVSRIWLTSLNLQSRVFIKTTIEKAIQGVLSEAGVTKKKLSSSSIKYNYDYDYLVQYQETDLNFMTRLLETAGAWYFFKEGRLSEVGKSEEEIIFTSTAESFQNIEGETTLTYKELSGLDGEEAIERLQVENHVIPKNVFIKNYNAQDPSSDLVGNASVAMGHVGTVYEYGGPLKDVTAVQNAAQILSNRINTQSKQLSGSGNCPRFRVGFKFKVKDHFRQDITNKDYILTTVYHSGGHQTGIATYSNRFQCIPVDLANTYAPEKRAIIPKVPGLITAKIEASGSDYATVDDKGRYKVKMHFDLSKTDNMSASKEVRLAQPYSGPQYGMHFPSHKDTEMLLACVEGDPSRPIGIGTIPNANTLPPVVSNNKHCGIIRTAGGNEFCMDDTDGKQKVHLVTKAQNIIKMDDENKRMTFQTTDQNMITIDDQNSVIQIVSNKHMISLSYADDTGIMIVTEKENVIKLDDQNKKITIQTGGGHQIDMDDNGKKIVLADGQGKSTVTLDGSKGIILDTKGKLSINATQDIEIKGANIKMSTTSGKIDVKATQDLSLAGLNINQKANVAMKIEGVQFEAKGSATVKLQGAMTELKGDATMKVSGGAMAEVSGGGMTTIKGGIVMIN